MLTQEDDVEIHALAARGWSVSAIARHTGRDRKTVGRNLAGQGAAKTRQPAPSCLVPYREYIDARFGEDPHLPAVTLLDELALAGFDRSYPTLVRELRQLELRPVCLVCQQRRGRAPTTEIDHPPGEEIQWDWLELTETPWGEPAYVLVGALSYSGRFRAVICEQMTFGHLAGALHTILEGLGGTARVWRVDRMATAVIPGTERLSPQFAALAKHYGVDVAICPPHRPQRKGVVEAAIRFLGGRWWRTARVGSLGQAQASLEAFCAGVSDRRGRRGSTVGELGAAEPLRALPALAYPAEISVERVASRSALVSFEGNRYSLPPSHAGRRVIVRARVGEGRLQVFSPAGVLLASHHRQPVGAGQLVRSRAHAELLEQAVLAAFTTQPSCARKINKPPGQAALAELARLRGLTAEAAPVISLDRYAELAEAAR
jgi:transposase